jgi:outer membrane protein OmpA-like peptidoglycan-associated protein
MSLKAQQDEQAAAERRAAAERAAQAQAQAQAEVTRRQQAEEQRLQAEQERLQAEQAKSEAERQQQQAQLAAQQAQQERQQAEAAQAAALAQQQASQAEAQRAQIAAQQAEHARLQAEQDKEAMRARLMEQLNQVLQTKDSARGLIVNMSDVLFDTGQATLKPGARERLAKVAGIILAYPDLNLQVEGHTDSVGSDQYNQRLSERRAEAVRAYLIAQGVRSSSISAQGFGKAQPIASNTTAAGRQLNRRVEMVVSGQAIGTVMSRPAGAAPSTRGGTAGTATAPGNPQIRTPASSAPAVGSPTGTPPPNPPR